MDKKIVTFDDIEIEKHKFYHHKKFNFARRCRYLKKMQVSNMVSSSEKIYWLQR